MISYSYILIISMFLVYYFAVLVIEKRLIKDPAEIIQKFLSILLLYAGISLIYYSFTGRPFLKDSAEEYRLYIFILDRPIGFVAIMLTHLNF